MYSQLKNILISASPFLVSIPFSYFNLNNFNSNEPRALWQPPGYVFGIVWTTLYTLLFIMNYLILSKNSFSDSFKNTVARDTLIEAALQGLWLNNFRSQQGMNITNNQYFISMITLMIILAFAIYRIYFFFFNKPPSSKLFYIALLYIPYFLWINLANILNIQLYLFFRF